MGGCHSSKNAKAVEKPVAPTLLQQSAELQAVKMKMPPEAEQIAETAPRAEGSLTASSKYRAQSHLAMLQRCPEMSLATAEMIWIADGIGEEEAEAPKGGSSSFR